MKLLLVEALFFGLCVVVIWEVAALLRGRAGRKRGG